MKPVFRATSPEDLERVREFLSKVTGRGVDTPMRQPDHMRWKYWEPRPDWDGSRSYIVERDGQILAHGAAWPMHLGPLRGFHLFDWGSDPGSPGMGAALLQKMAALADVVWVVAGTPDARRMRTATGFHAIQTVRIYALPIRPLRLAFTRPSSDWRSAAKWVRNQAWNLRAAAPEAGWKAVLLTDPQTLSGRWPQTGRFHSSLEFACYYAKCPAAPVRWFTVQHGGDAVGFFCLVQVPGQVRLAEASLGKPSRDAWRNLAALVIRTARGLDGANEVVAWASLRDLQDGLAEAGFQQRHQEDLMVCDPRKKLSQQEFDFQLLHGDLAFLHSGKPAYLC